MCDDRPLHPGAVENSESRSPDRRCRFDRFGTGRKVVTSFFAGRLRARVSESHKDPSEYALGTGALCQPNFSTVDRRTLRNVVAFGG